MTKCAKCEHLVSPRQHEAPLTHSSPRSMQFALSAIRSSDCDGSRLRVETSNSNPPWNYLVKLRFQALSAFLELDDASLQRILHGIGLRAQMPGSQSQNLLGVTPQLARRSHFLLDEGRVIFAKLLPLRRLHLSGNYSLSYQWWWQMLCAPSDAFAKESCCLLDNNWLNVGCLADVQREKLSLLLTYVQNTLQYRLLLQNMTGILYVAKRRQIYHWMISFHCFSVCDQIWLKQL